MFGVRVSSFAPQDAMFLVRSSLLTSVVVCSGEEARWQFYTEAKSRVQMGHGHNSLSEDHVVYMESLLKGY